MVEKIKTVVPPSKVVIRKLSPIFTKEEFIEAISPIPENSYFRFVAADKDLGQHGFSRAYINFDKPEEILSFRDKFDGYVFVDKKGNEYPALVEYATFQKIPKGNSTQKDARQGTIDEDQDYKQFLEQIENPQFSVPQIENMLEEIETMEKEAKANTKIKTPLLEYVEQRNAERLKGIERRRRREADRRKSREEEARRRKERSYGKYDYSYDEYYEYDDSYYNKNKDSSGKNKEKTDERKDKIESSRLKDGRAKKERLSESEPRGSKRYSQVRKERDLLKERGTSSLKQNVEMKDRTHDKNVEKKSNVYKSVGKSVDKNVEKLSDKNVEKSVDKNVEKLSDRNVEKLSDKNVEKSVVKNVEKLSDRNVEKLSDKNVEKLSEKNVEKFVDKNLQKLSDKNVEKRDKSIVEKSSDKNIDMKCSPENRNNAETVKSDDTVDLNKVNITETPVVEGKMMEDTEDVEIKTLEIEESILKSEKSTDSTLKLENTDHTKVDLKDFTSDHTKVDLKDFTSDFEKLCLKSSKCDEFESSNVNEDQNKNLKIATDHDEKILKSEETSFKSEEKSLESKGKDFKSEEKSSESEEKDIKSEEKSLESKGKDFKSEEKSLDFEEKSSESEEKDIKSEEKSLDSEEKSSESEEKRLHSEEKSLKSEEKDLKSGEKKLKSEEKSKSLKDQDGKDPRTERRIRNKDRPAMQLYRPGQSRLKKPSDEEQSTSSSGSSPVNGRIGVKSITESSSRPTSNASIKSEPPVPSTSNINKTSSKSEPNKTLKHRTNNSKDLPIPSMTFECSSKPSPKLGCSKYEKQSSETARTGKAYSYINERQKRKQFKET